MISVDLFFRDGEPVGFRCEGHALFAPEGSDIICSAVSALTINTVNSVLEFTDDHAHVEQDPEGGRLFLQCEGPVSDRTHVLLQSLFLGLGMIEETYGTEYLRITEYEEVSAE